MNTASSARGGEETTGILPKRLGRYILLSRLQEGGMTEVYAARLAKEVGPRRILVIKLLPKSQRDDTDAETRFLEEARIVLNLTHGNITTAFEFGRSREGRPFLVMEYVPGPSLRRLLNAESEGPPLDVADALFITGEVAKALSYAHAFATPVGEGRGLIHRDISPDNIILSTSGQVKLTDFGIATFMQSGQGGPLWGKAAYIAPEVAAGGPSSVASDLYSIGVVLYECLIGTPPLKGDSDKETLALLKSAQPEAPHLISGKIPQTVSDLVLALLSKRPEQRPASAAVLQVETASLLKSLDPAYTETALAAAVGKYFSPAAFAARFGREQIESDLLAVGDEIFGDETTDDLLARGTVPLGESGGKVPRPAHKVRSIAVLTALLIAVFLATAWRMLGADSGEEPPPPQTSVATTRLEELPLPVKGVTAPPPATATLPPSVSGAPEAEVLPLRDRAAHEEAAPIKMKMRPGGSKKMSGAAPVKSETKEPEWGWLNINSHPWSYVSVDGERLSGHTPYRRVKLMSGPHDILFENPDLGLTGRARVGVTPWEETNVGIRLK